MFSAIAIWCAARVERLEVGVVGAAVGVAQLVARELEVGPHLDQRQHPALQRR